MAEQAPATVPVFVEPTPNPNSLKFVLDRYIIQSGPYEFGRVEEASASPLAIEIFAISGVEGVFMGRNFVTVRKQDGATWDAIEAPAIELIQNAVGSGTPVVDEAAGPAAEPSGEGATGSERIIRTILDEEIRPAVASDGGDVRFMSFEDGVLKLKLVGACSGCPSSLMTLRMGIERRIRDDVPELVEVVLID